jgi:cytoskeletal protein CcmA (bactofilin family)
MPEEPVTLAQSPPAESEVYQAPPPPPPAEPEPPESTYAPAPQTYAPAPPTVAVPSLSASMSRTPDFEQGETIIGDGATIEGSVRSDRSIRVRGNVQGEIESKQRVVVDEAARVEAKITAEHVTILGELNGAITCTGRVEIASSARVTGEVTAGTLVIQEGAYFEGNLKMANAREDA